MFSGCVGYKNKTLDSVVPVNDWSQAPAAYSQYCGGVLMNCVLGISGKS
jgi:hypothetical protein